jgi:hypothetical protein
MSELSDNTNISISLFRAVSLKMDIVLEGAEKLLHTPQSPQAQIRTHFKIAKVLYFYYHNINTAQGHLAKCVLHWH